jgi:hypothetical protein
MLKLMSDRFAENVIMGHGGRLRRCRRRRSYQISKSGFILSMNAMKTSISL